MYVHVCTGMYMYVRVCTSMYVYVNVCTGRYVHVCLFKRFDSFLSVYVNIVVHACCNIAGKRIFDLTVTSTR